MGHLVALLIPLGLGGAVSPVVLTEETALLAAPDGRRNARLYALATTLTLLAIAALLVVFGGHLSLHHDPRRSAWIDLVLGVGLLLLGVRMLVRGPAPPKEGRPRRGPLAPRAVIGLGVVTMLTNASTLLLTLPAAKQIAAAHVSTASRAIATGIFVLIAAMPAWLPYALTVVAPGPAQRFLTVLRDLFARHGHTIGIVVLLALGGWLTVRGGLHL